MEGGKGGRKIKHKENGNEVEENGKTDADRQNIRRHKTTRRKRRYILSPLSLAPFLFLFSSYYMQRPVLNRINPDKQFI